MKPTQTEQPSLFDEPQLFPDLPGCIQGIVGHRETKDGRYAWDLQCQRCYAIETPKHLIIMRFKFPACTEQTYGQRTRICPPMPPRNLHRPLIMPRNARNARPP